MAKKVLIPLATGFEELEAISLIDLLIRAELAVTTVSLTENTLVQGAHGINIEAMTSLSQVENEKFDLVVLPGGMPGADNLENDPRVIQQLQQTVADGGVSAAICAAPKVLKAAGLLDGLQATSYPSFLDKSPAKDMEYLSQPVVDAGSIVTSRGPATAMEFALHLIEKLAGKEKRDEVASGLLYINS